MDSFALSAFRNFAAITFDVEGEHQNGSQHRASYKQAMLGSSRLYNQPRRIPSDAGWVLEINLPSRVFEAEHWQLRYYLDEPLLEIQWDHKLQQDVKLKTYVMGLYLDIAKPIEDIRNNHVYPDKIRLAEEKPPVILFNPLIDMIEYRNLRAMPHPLTVDGTRLLHSECDARTAIIDFSLVQIVQTDKFVLTEPGTLRSFRFDERKPKHFLKRDVMFLHFPFTQLKQFIIQDDDCQLAHQLDSPERREVWKKVVKVLFERERARHAEMDFEFSIPEIIIRPGKLVSHLCWSCSIII